MNISKFLANPHERAAEKKREEAKEAGITPPPPTAPASVIALELEEVSTGKWEGPCPACRAEGGDSKGNHLVVYESGAFGCTVHRGEDGHEHRQKMVALCPALRGKGGSYTPTPQADWSEADKKLAEAYRELWKEICEKFSGPLESLGESGPIPEEPREQFLLWGRTFFKPGQRGWVGVMQESREAFQRHLFELWNPDEASRAWEVVSREGLDVTRLHLWHDPAEGRQATNAHTPLSIVIEHDGPKENRTPLPQQVALLRYCVETLGLTLRMVISTGGKGIHGLFDIPPIPPHDLKRIIDLFSGIGADRASIQSASTRIPGATRQPSETNPGGNFQKILWINPEI